MRFRALLVGSLVWFLLGSEPVSAWAQTVDTQVGDTFIYGQNYMCLATAHGDQRLAAFIVRGPGPDKDEPISTAVYFSNKAEWDRFVSLWSQAHAKLPAARDNSNGGSFDIGNYEDEGVQGLLKVKVEDEHIYFYMIDKRKWVLVFRLEPKDFDAFGRNVEKVSDYFGK